MSHSVPPRGTLPLLLAALLAGACTRPLSPAGTPTPQPPQAVQEPLVTSMQVQAGDTVVLSLQVTNATGAPIAFTFPTGQTFDFVVRPAGGGAELWRWSADRGFTQAVQTRTLPPGETWRFDARWTPPPGVRGRLTATGRLVSADRPVEATAAFALP